MQRGLSDVVDQTKVFAESESLRYLKDRAGFTAPTVDASDLSHVDGPVRNILDVGCGSGINLKHLVDVTGAREGVGVEPGEASVRQLRENHSGDPRLRFDVAPAHALPFASRSFDLVICWSILHWVGREEFLQSLGELARVTARWLVIMDFVAAEDYRVAYSHRDGLFTYKVDFEALIMGSGVLELVNSTTWWEPGDGGPRVALVDEDLHPFRSHRENYFSRKVCTFRKDLDRLPVFKLEDFG
jgi:SAM-dependent methyltransferase